MLRLCSTCWLKQQKKQNERRVVVTTAVAEECARIVSMVEELKNEINKDLERLYTTDCLSFTNLLQLAKRNSDKKALRTLTKKSRALLTVQNVFVIQKHINKDLPSYYKLDAKQK